MFGFGGHTRFSCDHSHFPYKIIFSRSHTLRTTRMRSRIWQGFKMATEPGEVSQD